VGAEACVSCEHEQGGTGSCFEQEKVVSDERERERERGGEGQGEIDNPATRR